MSDKKFKITGSATDIDELVSTTLPFTGSDSGAPEFHRYVLICAGDGNITATTSSRDKAIEVHGSPSIKIEEEGRLLVVAARLNKVIKTIPENEKITLEVVNSGKSLHITTDKSFAAFLDLPAFNEKTSIPQVARNEDEEANGFVIDPNEMKTKFQTAAVSRDYTGNMKWLTGVLVQQNDDVLSLTATNGKGTLSLESAKVAEVIGDGIPEALLDVGLTGTALGYATSGDKVSVLTYPSSTVDGALRELYFNVTDKDGEPLYFIKIGTLALDKNKYPRTKLIDFVRSNSQTDNYVTVNKLDLLEILNQAAVVGSVDNEENVRGQNKEVSISVEGDELTAYVESGSRNIYENTIQLEEAIDSEDPVEFRIAFGLHGEAIRSYDSSELISIALIPRPKTTTPAFTIMFHPNGKTESGAVVGKRIDGDDLPVTLALFPLVSTR